MSTNPQMDPQRPHVLMSTPFSTEKLKTVMLQSLEQECASRYTSSMRLLEEQATEIKILRLQRDALREVAVRAAETFRAYEELHSAKHTPEGDQKAASNRNLALSIENLLKRIDL